MLIIKFNGAKIKGNVGEKRVANILSTLDNTKYKVINNLMIRTERGTTQIDHVVISIYGIFVIETKNYKGLIFGSENDENWTQVIYKNKGKFRNPIKQNNGHIKAIKDLIPEIRYKKIKSIILFSKRARLNVNAVTDVTYINKVSKIIKSYKTKEYTIEEVERIFKKLEELNVNSFKERKAHVKNVKRTVKNAEKKLKKNRCPRCGGKLKKKKSKYGKFKGCKNYPNCTFKLNA